MSDALIIALELKGLAQVQAGLRAVAKQVQQIQSGGTGGGVGQRGASQQATQSAAKIARAVKPPPTFMDRLAKVIKSSRVGVGGGLMPLVGPLADLIGSTGPLGIAVVAGAAAVAGLALAAVAAAADIRDFRDAMNTSGGSVKETAGLKALGTGTGSSAGELAQMAREFREATTQGGYAAAIASKAGIANTPGPMGKVDTAGDLLKFAQYLRTVDAQLGREEAIRQARVTKTEGLLKFLDISDKLAKRLAEDANIQSQVYEQLGTHSASELQVSAGRFTDALSTFWDALSGPMIKDIVKILNNFADDLYAAAQLLANNQNKVQGVYDLIKSLIELVTLHFVSALADAKKAIAEFSTPEKKAEDKHTTALDKHTQAMDAHSQAMKDGTFGGGARARNAHPENWRGMNVPNWEGQARTMGAFA